MGLPLTAAFVVEAAGWELGRYHRWLEIGALAYFLGDLSRGPGLFTAAIHTLFVLAGVRLILPREPTQRRQLLLIGFLLFLTTALGSTDITFLLWTLSWSCTASLALLQLSWEPSAALRRGTLVRPPYGRVPVWVGAALLFGAGFFLIMPRPNLGLRGGLLLGSSRGFSQASLSDRLDLSGGSPIEPNPEVAVRIAPPPGLDPATDLQWSRGMELLRGITLESLRDQRWESSDQTPPRAKLQRSPVLDHQAEFLFTSSSQGILTLPDGLVKLEPLDAPIAPGPGASLRWRFPRSRTIPLTVTWMAGLTYLPEPVLSVRRLELLTRLDSSHEAARRASFRFAPDILTAPGLVHSLEASLRRFRYTLDNPSGKALNPLEDFLERTQAGHCEYFASAMALMLRARGVPARVVNGYRLGPWIPEGGYFRVSQNEAHSWVEYWHEGRWATSDPTPQGAVAAISQTQGLKTLERWVDALRYRWDRYVVRFSDQDQLAGFSWLQGQFQSWEWRWKAPSKAAQGALALAVLAWLFWRSRSHWRPALEGPGQIRALRPLLRHIRRSVPVEPGDTARSWLLRLAALRPERQEALQQLADAIEAQTYGPGHAAASALAKAEAAAWRGWRPGVSSPS
jgi:transglutaminase-like putative cysteine protease